MVRSIQLVICFASYVIIQNFACEASCGKLLFRVYSTHWLDIDIMGMLQI